MTATYTEADKTALLIVILQDGARITTVIENTGKRGWLVQGLKNAGRGISSYRAYITAAVLIDGTEIHHYAGTEPAEILGLDA